MNTVVVSGVMDSAIGGTGNDAISTVSAANIVTLTDANSMCVSLVNFSSVENILGSSGVYTLRVCAEESFKGLLRYVLDFIT